MYVWVRMYILALANGNTRIHTANFDTHIYIKYMYVSFLARILFSSINLALSIAFHFYNFLFFLPFATKVVDSFLFAFILNYDGDSDS